MSSNDALRAWQIGNVLACTGTASTVAEFINRLLQPQRASQRMLAPHVCHTAHKHPIQKRVKHPMCHASLPSRAANSRSSIEKRETTSPIPFHVSQKKSSSREIDRKSRGTTWSHMNFPCSRNPEAPRAASVSERQCGAEGSESTVSVRN
ncbi:hypothetical protein B0H14DRAFT_3736371 [Mycena olivaceomarginata]|nr:hypothetical protein B0H14DRAFT_3736371 [Mycena olivaceomarginata]